MFILFVFIKIEKIVSLDKIYNLDFSIFLFEENVDLYKYEIFWKFRFSNGKYVFIKN